MQAELLVLRVIHVLGGIIWVGGGVMMAIFLAPAVAEAGPAGGQVMQGMMKRKMMIVLPVIALLTILSGLRLLMIMSGNFGPGYFQTGAGRTFATAGLLALIAFVFGFAVNRPIMMKMGTLSQSMASDPASKDAIAAEIKKLQGRAAMAGTTVLVLLLLAALGMSIARYL